MNIRERSASEQERIVEHFRSRIATGSIPVGERLPTESEIGEMFEASRYTVREALRRLQDVGLIERRQGSGSVVTSAREVKSFHSSLSSIPDLLQYAGETRLDILAADTIIAGEAESQLFGVAEGGVWRKLHGLRHDARGGLIAYSEILIAEAYAAVAEPGPGQKDTIFARIEAAYGIQIARVFQDMRASVADLNVANRLAIAPGQPVLVVRRTYLSEDDNIVEVSLNHHPSNRFSYVIVMERS